MSRPNLIRQIYGYLVCLIAIITFLMAANSIVGAIFDLNRPAGIADPYGPNPTFDEYRNDQLNADRMQQRQQLQLQPQAGGPTTPEPVQVRPDSTLRREYNEMRVQRSANVHWNALKSIVTSVLMLVIALVLFLIHWRWLRGLERREETHA